MVEVFCNKDLEEVIIKYYFLKVKFMFGDDVNEVSVLIDIGSGD